MKGKSLRDEINTVINLCDWVSLCEHVYACLFSICIQQYYLDFANADAKRDKC